ncbi:MAG: hypothetical protein AAF321_12435, partial [Pseudomonadota bacterium]
MRAHLASLTLAAVFWAGPVAAQPTSIDDIISEPPLEDVADDATTLVEATDAPDETNAAPREAETVFEALERGEYLKALELAEGDPATHPVATLTAARAGVLPAGE